MRAQSVGATEAMVSRVLFMGSLLKAAFGRFKDDLFRAGCLRYSCTVILIAIKGWIASMEKASHFADFPYLDEFDPVIITKDLKLCAGFVAVLIATLSWH